MTPLPTEDTWKDASTKGKEAKMVFHPFVNTLSAGPCNHKMMISVTTLSVCLLCINTCKHAGDRYKNKQ